MNGEYVWYRRKYPSYEDYVMSLRVEHIADSMDFLGKVNDVDERIEELKIVMNDLLTEKFEWEELSNHFYKEEK